MIGSENFNIYSRLNRFFITDSSKFKDLPRRLMLISLPIMHMYAPTRRAATLISTGILVVHMSREAFQEFKSGNRKKAGLQMVKVLFRVAAVTTMILFPVQALILSSIYQFGSDISSLGAHIACGERYAALEDLFSIFDQAVFTVGSIGQEPEPLLLTALLQAGKEFYQASLEFNQDRHLESGANLFYAGLRIHIACRHAKESYRIRYGKLLTQEGLNELLIKASRLVAEAPGKTVSFDSLLAQKNCCRKLKNLSFVDKKISHLVFNKIGFDSCELSGTEFLCTVWGSTHLKSCDFRNVKITDSDFLRIYFSETNFKDVVFSNCILHREHFSVFDRCLFERVDWDQCQLGNTLFFGTHFFETKFNNSTLTRLKMVESKRLSLGTSDVRSTIFHKMNFSDSRLLQCDFYASTFEESNFTRCDLTATVFQDATLRSVRFDRSVLAETSFFNAIIRSSTIQDSDLTNCLLFDRKKEFEIKNSLHSFTKPVVAMIWDFSSIGTLLALKMEQAIKEAGGIVFRFPAEPNDIKREILQKDVQEQLEKMVGRDSRAQTVLARAPDGSQIAKVKEIINKAAPYLNGVFLPGGDNVEPEFYQKTSTNQPNYLRSMVEFSLLSAAAERSIPTFGVCRGAQLINVFFGGTLHSVPGHWGTYHQFKMSQEQVASPMGKIALDIIKGSSIEAYSCHMQAINSTGKGLIPVLWHQKDIEMIISENGLIVGTQFHPETYLIAGFGSSESFKLNKNFYSHFVHQAGTHVSRCLE